MNEKALREHLVNLLSGRGAHVDWKASFSGIPPKLRGVRPEGLPHSLWELLEHLRIAQWDILDFSRDRKHVSPEWPAGYWPVAQALLNAKAWDKSLKSFARDLDAMKELVTNSKTDLFAKIPHGTGQTILREALLRGPQCVSFGAGPGGSAHSGKLEQGSALIVVSRVVFLVSIRYILFILASECNFPRPACI